MRHEERAQAVLGNDATGVADDVGIAGFQAQGANREPRIHTSQDSEVTLRARREPAQFVSTGVDFVCLENFVNDTHGRNSLAGSAVATESVPMERIKKNEGALRKGGAGAWVVLCRNIRRRGLWLRGRAGCGQSFLFA